MIQRLLFILLVIPAAVLTVAFMLPTFAFVALREVVLFIKDGKEMEERFGLVFWPVVLLHNVLLKDK